MGLSVMDKEVMKTTDSKTIANAENLKIEGDTLDFPFENSEVLAQKVARASLIRKTCDHAKDRAYAAKVGP